MSKIGFMVLICVVTLALCTAAFATTLFEDEFTSTGVDGNVYYTEGSPSQADGMVYISSSPDKVQSRAAFTVGDGSVTRLEMRARFSQAPQDTAGSWFGFTRLGGAVIGSTLFGDHWVFGGVCAGSAQYSDTQFDTTTDIPTEGIDFAAWHTYTILSNATGRTFYIDGELVATHPLPGEALTDSHVGMMKNEGTQPKMWFDWVRLSDTDGTTDARQDGNIHGVVTNAATSQPVAEAIVSGSDGQTILTNADGYYNFTVAPGAYDVAVTKAGYVSQTVVGEDVAAYGSRLINFSLSPNQVPGTLSGKVTEAGKTGGIPSVKVDAGGGNVVYAGEDGAYSMSLPPGVYTVTFTVMGFAQSVQSDVAVASSNTTTLNVSLARSCQAYLFEDFDSVPDPAVWYTSGTPVIENGTVKLGLGDNVQTQAAWTSPGYTCEVRARWTEQPTYNAQWFGWMQLGGGDPRWMVGYWGSAFRTLTPGGFGPVLDSTGSIDLTQWHEYAIQGDATVTRVFMDGVQMATAGTYALAMHAGAFVGEGPADKVLEIDWIRVSDCNLAKGAFVGSLGDARQQDSGTPVQLTGDNVVTAVFDNRLYIEEETRASGIQVSGVFDTALLGKNVEVSGVLDKSGCAPKVVSATVTDAGAGDTILPVGSPNKPLVPGSAGAELQGMLVTVWGEVVDSGYDADYNAFYVVDDGSGVYGGSDPWDPNKVYTGIRVRNNAQSFGTGDYIRATGIAECGVTSGDPESHVEIILRDENTDMTTVPK